MRREDEVGVDQRLGMVERALEPHRELGNVDLELLVGRRWSFDFGSRVEHFLTGDLLNFPSGSDYV